MVSPKNTCLRNQLLALRSGPAPLGGRRDTEMETALILEDLDHLLDTEELTLEQRMTRLEVCSDAENLFNDPLESKQRKPRYDQQ